MDSVAKAGDNTGIGVHFAFGFYGINHQLRRTWHQNNLRFFLDGTRCILWYIFTPNFLIELIQKANPGFTTEIKMGKLLENYNLKLGFLSSTQLKFIPNWWSATQENSNTVLQVKQIEIWFNLSLKHLMVVLTWTTPETNGLNLPCFYYKQIFL